MPILQALWGNRLVKMSNYKNLPAPSPENGLSRYLQEIRKFPMLEPEQVYMLAKRWVEEHDSDAAH